MEDRRISDSQIIASSEYFDGNYHGANNARLNRPAMHTRGGWVAETEDLNQWIQVDLMISTWVTGVKIQGREDWDQWVTEYKVEYSSDGQNWMHVQSNGDREVMVSSTPTK